MAALPELRLGCEFYMSSYYASEDIAQTPFPVQNGKVIVPQGAGLGVAPDREKLKRFQTAHLTETA